MSQYQLASKQPPERPPGEWRDILSNPVAANFIAEDYKYPELTGNCLYMVEQGDTNITIHFGPQGRREREFHPEADAGTQQLMKKILSDIPCLSFGHFKAVIDKQGFTRDFPNVALDELVSLVHCRMARSGVLQIEL